MWYGILTSLRIFHTVKGFSIVSEADVSVFMEVLCFLFDPVNVNQCSFQ